jgi:hypothetical protein
VNPLMEVLPINVYVTIQLVLVDLQDLVLRAPGPRQNASMAHVHVPIAIMRAELLVEHVQLVNIAN